MNRNVRFLVGGLVIVGAVAWLMFTGIRETSAYYFEIGEFLEKKETLRDTDLRVAGRVAPGSISWNARDLDLHFSIGEFEKNQAGGPTVPVAFKGIKPDMFDEGRDVIIEGRYDGDVLIADKVLTSCPSKYEAIPEEGESPPDAAPGAQRARI